jgi:alkanesulfonate monooxygenase SsuD/methylene tetrahydromethanopterin reductase-like flavin-dependent oxidoreductase (luciferase family)
MTQASHPLSFGVITIQNAPWDTLMKRWKFIESAGFDSLWVADHFTVPYPDYADMPFFEAWTTLAAMAAQTMRIRIGTLVTAITWRNPAWLARQALTVDHLSQGRLELGIGAGSSTDIGVKMIGLDAWPRKERVERFREYVEIVDTLLRQPTTSYHGEYYHIEKAPMQPRPIQQPRPPLTIGAYGPRMLKLTARYADMWNCIGGVSDDAISQLTRRNQQINDYCKAIGRDPHDIRRSYILCDPVALRNLGPISIYNSAEAFQDAVDKCLHAGITTIILGYPFANNQIPKFESIAKQTIPKIRQRYKQNAK